MLIFRWVRRLVLAVVLSLLLVVGGTAAAVWWTGRTDARPHSDAIVVLGASQYNGRPSAIFAARLDHARQLYDAGVAPTVVTVGGGAPGDQYTEAASGAAYLGRRGVRTLAVPEGRDTLQSMQAVSRAFTARRWRTAVLVTDPWHMLRSRRMATDLGITAVTSPVRQGPAVRDRGTELRYVARETAAYLYYRLFHASSENGPRAA